jgi:gliding motility-associated-like protein
MKSFFYKLALFTCFLGISNVVFSQNYQRSIRSVQDGSFDLDITSVIALKNGNVVTAGIHQYRSLYPMFTCTAPSGIVLWRKNFDTSNSGGIAPSLVVTKMIPLENGNFLSVMCDLFTFLRLQGTVSKGACIAEISGSNGDILWIQTLADLDNPVALYDVQQEDDGYIVAGSQDINLTLAKIGLTGQLVWQRTYSYSNQLALSTLRNIDIDAEGNIYAVNAISSLVSPEVGTNFLSVIKFEESGSIVWSKEYTNPQRGFSDADIALTSSGAPVVWGTTFAPGPVDYRPFVMELSATDGAIIQTEEIQSTEFLFTASSIHHIDTDQFLLVASQSGAGSLAHYIKYDLSEGLKWSFYDDKTPLTGNAITSFLDANLMLHNVSARLTITPLDRVYILTKTDMVAIGLVDCCHKPFTIALNDAVFDDNQAIYTSVTPVWTLVAYNPQFQNLPIQIANICINDNNLSINSDTINCTGSCVKFITNLPNTPIVWQTDGQATIVSDTGAVFCFNEPGTYTITAKSQVDTCRRTVTSIKIEDIPVSTIIQLDTLTCPGECIRFELDTILANYQYSWTFEGGVPDQFSGPVPPTICYEQAGNFNVQVNITAGCIGQSTTKTAVAYKPFIIPNAFTPDSDGTNDVFRPIFRCPTTNFRMAIYSRWGEKIFETTNPDTGWDGRVKNAPAPVDVYIWQIEVTDQQDTEVIMAKSAGEVTLLR